MGNSLSDPDTKDGANYALLPRIITELYKLFRRKPKLEIRIFVILLERKRAGKLSMF